MVRSASDQCAVLQWFLPPRLLLRIGLGDLPAADSTLDAEGPTEPALNHPPAQAETTGERLHDDLARNGGMRDQSMVVPILPRCEQIPSVRDVDSFVVSFSAV